MIQTLNQHIKLFSDFATNHKQINSFGFGDPWEWYNNLKQDNENLVYPAMFVTADAANLTGYNLQRPYTVFICDLVRHAEQNENDVLSDTQLIALDFLAYLKKEYIGSQALDLNTTLEPFTERGTDYVAGWQITVTFRETFEYNNCQIPIN